MSALPLYKIIVRAGSGRECFAINLSVKPAHDMRLTTHNPNPAGRVLLGQGILAFVIGTRPYGGFKWCEFAEGVIPCCAGTGSPLPCASLRGYSTLGWSLRAVLPLCLDGWGIDSVRQNGVAICSLLAETKEQRHTATPPYCDSKAPAIRVTGARSDR